MKKNGERSGGASLAEDKQRLEAITRWSTSFYRQENEVSFEKHKRGDLQGTSVDDERTTKLGCRNWVVITRKVKFKQEIDLLMRMTSY